MMRSMYAKRDVIKYYFTLPNQIFDLGLHYIEIAISLLNLSSIPFFEGGIKMKIFVTSDIHGNRRIMDKLNTVL